MRISFGFDGFLNLFISKLFDIIVNLFKNYLSINNI